MAVNVVLGLCKAIMYITYRPKIVTARNDIKKELKGKPCIFVSNHISHNDGLFAGAVLSRYKPYSLVAKDWYDKKTMGFFLKQARTVPIDRYNPDGDWYLLGQDIIKKGCPMLIFPEGKTSRDGIMNEFRPGAALLAAKMSVPIVPCAIVGKYRKLFGERQKFIIGEPIEMNCPEDLRPSRYAKEQTVIIQSKVQKLLDDN